MTLHTAKAAGFSVHHDGLAIARLTVAPRAFFFSACPAAKFPTAFAFQLTTKFTQRGIQNAFAETLGFRNPQHVQIVDAECFCEHNYNIYSNKMQP